MTGYGVDVAVTHGGGLYLRCADDYSDTNSDVNAYARLLNLIACEVSLEGHFARPITYYDIGPSKLIGNYIGSPGGIGLFPETHWQPFSILAAQPRGDEWAPLKSWFLIDPPGLLDRVSDLNNVRILRNISDDLPVLVGAAIYHAARHNLAEAITTGWITCEVILDYWWDKYRATLDSSRSNRLKDTRTYSAAVRTEVLMTSGFLSPELYERLNLARQIRNNLAHRARAERSGAMEVTLALKATLNQLNVNTAKITWSENGGGFGRPEPLIEPTFRFRRSPSSLS